MVAHPVNKDIRVITQKTVSKYIVSLREDGILHGHVLNIQKWSPEDHKMLVHVIGEMVNYQKVPFLITYEKFMFPGAEATAYWANPDTACPYICAEAIIVDSLPLKVLGNFYMQFNKPGRPTKMFEKKECAIDWLKTFLNMNF